MRITSGALLLLLVLLAACGSNSDERWSQLVIDSCTTLKESGAK